MEKIDYCIDCKYFVNNNGKEPCKSCRMVGFPMKPSNFEKSEEMKKVNLYV